MNYIFIDTGCELDKIGFVEENRLIEIYFDSKDKTDISSIYRGRVKDIVRGMESAFIDIGFEKNAYINLKDAVSKDKLYSRDKFTITDFLREGEEVIVQVKKQGNEKKGPKVTTHIEIPSMSLILTPYSNKIRVSRKIRQREEAERLKEIGRKIQVRDYGMIFRTSSYLESEEKLENEYKSMLEIYEKLERERNFLPCPKLLYRPILDWEFLILNKLEDLDKIIVNRLEKYKEIEELLDKFELPKEKLLLDESYSFQYDERVYKYFNQALKRKLDLKSGGSIVIDELEALTAIDVNSEGVNSKKSLRKNILKTNLEAAIFISQEIRLRNISGIILIDFINMDKKEDRDYIIKVLENELNKDSIKSNIYGFTKLGLLEIARSKKRKSLKEIL